jgi:hypothetical protein
MDSSALRLIDARATPHPPMASLFGGQIALTRPSW